jgi:hypothetical protein
VSSRTPLELNASPWNVNEFFIFGRKLVKLKEIDFAWGSSNKKKMKS